MDIPVTVGNKTYYLCSEPGEFSLCREVTVNDKKTGESRLEKQGFKFYPSLAVAIKSLFQMKIGASCAKTLHELQSDVDKANRELQGLYEHKGER